MRLSDTEIKAIKMLAAKWFGDGSRADIQAKGGDLSLHIVAGSSVAATLKNEIAFVLDLQDRIDRVAAERGIIL